VARNLNCATLNRRDYPFAFNVTAAATSAIGTAMILYTFNEPEEERLTLFVRRGEDTTKEFNLIV